MNKKKRLYFTRQSVENIKISRRSEQESYYDTKVSSLELRVSSKGSKTYNVYKWSTALGRPTRVKIGKHPVISIAEARKKANQIISEIEHGADHNNKRKSIISDLTLADAFDYYVNKHCRNFCRPKTIKDYKSFFMNHLSEWSQRKLCEIKPKDILDLQNKVRRKNKGNQIYASNRAVELLSQVYNLKIAHGWEGKNPCAQVRLFPERRRERFLDEHELGPFIEAALEERKCGNMVIADAVLTALFTSVRRENIQSANWPQFNLERDHWSIDWSDVKNSGSQNVFLSTFVSKIIKGRYDFQENIYVFPSKESATGHFVDPRSTFRRIVKRSGINPKGLKFHSLKHTFVSYAWAAGVNPLIIPTISGHKVTKVDIRCIPQITSKVYGHTSSNALREGYKMISDYMLSFCFDNIFEKI